MIGIALAFATGLAVLAVVLAGRRLEWGSSRPIRDAAPGPDVKFIDANGLRFAYVEKGSGPLVLLFHGYPETARLWREVQDRISVGGYRVVAPFMRGYPPSSSPSNADYRGETLGQDILALIDAFETESAVVVGHDWGAGAAYIAAAKEPQRIKRLVAISMPHPRGFEAAWKFIFAAPHFLYYQLPWARRIVWSHNFAHITRIYRRCSPSYRPDADVLAEIRSTFSKPGALEGALGYYWSAFKRGSSGSTSVGSISVPSLVIAGTEDGPIDIAMFAQARPAFIGPYSFVELKAVGHFPQLEAPAQTAEAILKFLAE